ncbi:MFS transporter [Pseudomonas solani]|uniref:MFS transporter n=1 Tax=Pseudomonas solani TaxID=2731552 RepID=A0ABN6BV95_9PSED|nr:MFS transporter [Pseudomonas solani]BCD86484.1 MFS transporter [Pseudomonas solani]
MHINSSHATAPATSLVVQMILCAVAVVSLLYVPVPILARLAQDYQLPLGGVGLSLMVFSVCYACGFLIFGPLSDRLGRRAVLVTGLVVLAVASAAMVFVSSSKAFLAMRALQGLAAASYPPVAIAYLSEHGSPRQRAWGVAWLSTAFLTAGLLGQLYGSLVAATWGFGLAMVPLSAIYIITAITLLSSRNGLRKTGAPGHLLSIYRPLFQLLSDPQLRRVYVPASLLLMAFVAFYVDLDRRLLSGLGQGIDPLFARAVALPGLFAPLAVAGAIQRWGANRVASSGLAVSALGLFLVAVVGEHSLFWLLASSVVFVAGIGISVPGLIASTSTRAPEASRGLAVALYTFFLFLGASLAPWVVRLGGAWKDSALFLVLASCIAAAAMYSATESRRRAR